MLAELKLTAKSESYTFKKSTLYQIVFDYICSLNKDITSLIALYKKKQNRKELDKIEMLIGQLESNLDMYLSDIFDKFNVQKLSRLGDMHAEKSCTMLIELIERKIIFKSFHPYFIELMNHVFNVLNQSNKFNYHILYYEVDNQKTYIEHIENEAIKDINKFSFHYGGLILLLTLLRGTDFHGDNILCKNSLPIMIDFETLFYPNISIFKKYDVTATSLIKTNNNKHTFMHRENLNIQAVKKGIAACCFLIKQNKELFNMLIGYYYDYPRRVIFKPTKFYLEILKNSTHPILLADDKLRKQYLDECLNLKKNSTYFITDYEINDLMDLNIPYFYFLKGKLYSSRWVEIYQDSISSSLNDIYNDIDKIEDIRNEIIAKL